MRSFEFARKVVENENGVKETLGVQAYLDAQLPEYQTKHAAGADFFCAEEVTIKPLWESVFSVFGNRLSNAVKCLAGKEVSDKEKDSIQSAFAPTKVHTGIKANMEDNEVLELYNRSSNPKNLGLVLANGVGVVDSDYYNSPSNDGEIMFAFYNVLPWSVTLKVGDRIGQGVFKRVLRPIDGLRVKDVERTGGFGSTNNTPKSDSNTEEEVEVLYAFSVLKDCYFVVRLEGGIIKVLKNITPLNKNPKYEGISGLGIDMGLLEELCKLSISNSRDMYIMEAILYNMPKQIFKEGMPESEFILYINLYLSNTIDNVRREHLEKGIKDNTVEYRYMNCLVPVCSKGNICKGNAFIKGEEVIVHTKSGEEVHGVICELQDSHIAVGNVIVTLRNIKSISKLV